MRYKLDPTNNHAPDESAYIHLVKIQREIKENDVRGFDVYHREVTGLYAKIDTLQAENQRLREALAPFAAFRCTAHNEEWGGEFYTVERHDTGKHTLMVEDFRRARALLAKEPTK